MSRYNKIKEFKIRITGVSIHSPPEIASGCRFLSNYRWKRSSQRKMAVKSAISCSETLIIGSSYSITLNFMHQNKIRVNDLKLSLPVQGGDNV